MVFIKGFLKLFVLIHHVLGHGEGFQEVLFCESVIYVVAFVGVQNRRNLRLVLNENLGIVQEFQAERDIFFIDHAIFVKPHLQQMLHHRLDFKPENEELMVKNGEFLPKAMLFRVFYPYYVLLDACPDPFDE